MNDQSLYLSEDEILHFVGPALDAGPLPAFFYFSLSGKESLTLDPFNQPVQFLSHLPLRASFINSSQSLDERGNAGTKRSGPNDESIAEGAMDEEEDRSGKAAAGRTPDEFMKEAPLRIFSLDIPKHPFGGQPKEALTLWAEEIQKGHDLISPFSAQVEKALNYLFHHHCLIEGKIGVGGLSRGAFLALHLGARLAPFNPILGFAPLIRLDQNEHIIQKGVAEKGSIYNVRHLIPSLLSKTVRLHIGNRDTLVGTQNAFSFAEALVEAKFKAGHPLLDVELIIKPSIGNRGHGTSPEVFSEGAHWMAQQLGIAHDSS